jgi:hypothetical protein
VAAPLREAHTGRTRIADPHLPDSARHDPALTIYLALVDDVVQLLGFECDFGYYELIRDDPDD